MKRLVSGQGRLKANKKFKSELKSHNKKIQEGEEDDKMDLQELAHEERNEGDYDQVSYEYRGRAKYWDALPWKKLDVDVSEFDQESMFFGLEEIDGNQYKLFKDNSSDNKIDNDNSTNSIERSEKKKEKDKKQKKVKDNEKSSEITVNDVVHSNATTSVDNKDKKEKQHDKKIPVMPKLSKTNEIVSDVQESWGGVSLHELLKKSLQSLQFTTPTPIQARAIPIIHSGLCDLVGIAETGSGKTLAFGLPIVNSILNNWEIIRNNVATSTNCPYSIIIAPTRELAMQITKVLKELCDPFKSVRMINIVSVVGGMAEQKQRRLLDRTVDILVATPGRLCELVAKEEIKAFSDMAYVKFLVVDEADRIVEEGHFSELHRVFSRITDHEKLKQLRGGKPKSAEVGTYDIDEEEDYNDDNDDNEEDMKESAVVADDNYAAIPTFEVVRQTLLFSATALKIKTDFVVSGPQRKELMKMLSTHANSNIANIIRKLPEHLQSLVASVAVQQDIRIVDVTDKDLAAAPVATKQSVNLKGKVINQSTPESEQGSMTSLPKLLCQYEIRTPTEDKDAFVYYYVLKNQGRTLLFVNSIKTARRIDGLLRALGLNSRTIHAQMQQKQRLKALESFKASPIGILVATDVAARGLDISKIQHVLHYDVARSPQLYIHRSGRTARANTSGVTVSFVSPEDTTYHGSICSVVGVLMPYHVELRAVPMLRERVKVAKKIFTILFVQSQTNKEKSWLEQSAQEADLEVDDYMLEEVRAEGISLGNHKKNKDSVATKQKLETFKKQLQVLLNTPVEGVNAIGGKKGFVVVAK